MRTKRGNIFISFRYLILMFSVLLTCFYENSFVFSFFCSLANTHVNMGFYFV